MRVPADVGAALDLARTHLSQGLLSEAEQILASVTADSSLANRGSAQLLLGNIAYERGDYARASEAWNAAAALFSRDESMGDAYRVVSQNLAMAEAKLARNSELMAAAQNLRLALALCVVFFVIALAVACKRSATTSRSAAPATTARR